MANSENNLTPAEAIDLILLAITERIGDLSVIWDIADILHRVPELYGCTDKNAANYNRFAKYDDGSCQYYAAIPQE